MADDSKSFEKKLDRDFLYYLTLTKQLFENLKEDKQKRMCKVWLNYLFGKTSNNAVEKCDRNVYLSRLILQMQNGRLKGIFLDSPPAGPLPSSFSAFGLPTEIDGLKGFEEKGFQVDSSVGVGSGDFFESSRDGRTYLATRHLPQGVMAYLAVTNNEGDPVWVPQPCPPTRATSLSKNFAGKQPEGFIKKLVDFVDVPLSECRKSSEDRERVLEWMDKIISDCNKWIQGEDPHNMELEQLFEQMYEDYKKDPDKSEILKHPRQVRNIIFKDIRDKITERRAEVTERELILDQYESDQYDEVNLSDEFLDEIWLNCAKKPLNETIKAALYLMYPSEVVERFFELLYQERLLIIQKGERRAKQKMNELKRVSMEETKKELQKLKKVQDDYKEYYCISKEIEQRLAEFEKERKGQITDSGNADQQSEIDNLRREVEKEIQKAKQNFEKQRRTQRELQEKLEEAKDSLRKMCGRMATEDEKLNCKLIQICNQKNDLEEQISDLKRKREEVKRKLNGRNGNNMANCRGRR